MPWAFSLLQARCSCRVGAVLRSGTLCTDPLICNKKRGSLTSCRGRSRLFGMFGMGIGCFAPVNPYRFLRSLVDIEGFPASNLPIHRKHFLECFSHLKLLCVRGQFIDFAQVDRLIRMEVSHHSKLAFAVQHHSVRVPLSRSRYRRQDAAA